MVYVSDPELIRVVTVKNPHKFERSNFVSLVVPSISKGLFAAVGKAHARQKRIIGPAFSSANLQGFFSTFQENSKNLVQVRIKDGAYCCYNCAYVLRISSYSGFLCRGRSIPVSTILRK